MHTFFRDFYENRIYISWPIGPFCGLLDLLEQVKTRQTEPRQGTASEPAEPRQSTPGEVAEPSQATHSLPVLDLRRP